MGVRAGKQHTTQTNRLGARNGKPEGNPDDIGRTTQSRDWTFSCGSWREGKGRNPNPCNIKSVLQENRAWPVRDGHGEEMTDEKGHCCSISLPLHQRQSTAEAAANGTLQRGGNTSHLTQPERPPEPSKPAQTLPVHGGTPGDLQEHHQTEHGRRRTWRSRRAQSRNAPRLRGSGWVSTSPPGQGAPAGAALLLQHITSEHHTNPNTAVKSAERLTETKYYPIKLGLSINVAYIHRIVNCSYI